jgi:hypothetical protein
MPMPDYSGVWPPEPWDQAQDAYNLWSAWLEGDTFTLQRLYQLFPDGTPAVAHRSQYYSGFLGRLARFWWGRPPMQSSTKRLHVPAPADVARTSADLLFGQPPQWVLTDGEASDLGAAQDRLNILLEGADTVATLLEAAEIQAALGGAYLRLWWDKDAVDKVMVGTVAPDCAIPEWRYGMLSAVTFWTTVCDDKTGVWRHLERHEPGAIFHALYKGDDGDIGRLADLSEQPATAWAADLVDTNGSIATRVSGLTAAYVPNVRPSRKWRNVPMLSPLGRSDFEGLESLFDSLDEAYSSWMRDLDLAKARLFVAEDALTDAGPGNGSYWDPEQAIYSPVPGTAMGLPEDKSSLVQAQQFEIRHAEHKATCDALMNRILVAAGYSIGDFGDDQMASSITATEVSARQDLSNRTRSKKVLYWQSAMAPLARTMLEVDQIVYGGSYGIKANPEMKFPVRADQSPIQLSQTIMNLRTADAISIEASVRMFNPNMSSDDVDAEVDRIKEEMQVSVPAPGDFAGQPPEDPTMQAHSDLQDDGTDSDNTNGGVAAETPMAA